jgi:DNA primase
MKIQVLLSRLQKVRSEGQDRWRACCPAHDDGTPSLSIRELDDGRVLLYCHAHCKVEDVLGALGLQFSDLYPDRLLGHGLKGTRSRLVSARQALEIVAKESLLVAVFAADQAQGKLLTEADRSRLMLAAGRIHAAYQEAIT